MKGADRLADDISCWVRVKSIGEQHVDPHVILFCPTGVEVISMNLPDNEVMRDLYAIGLRVALQIHKADAYAVVSEAWMIIRNKDDDLDVAPAEADDRIEITLICVETRNGQHCLGLRITRDENKNIVGFEPIDVGQDFHGRFMGLLFNPVKH